MPNKTVVKLKPRKEDLLPKFEIEYTTLGMIRSVMTDKKPFGKFLAKGEDKYIYVVSNTTGKPELDAFPPEQEAKAKKWLNNHE